MHACRYPVALSPGIILSFTMQHMDKQATDIILSFTMQHMDKQATGIILSFTMQHMDKQATGIILSFAMLHTEKASIQSLSQWSKTRTSLADPASASGATFQCMQFLPFLSIFSYLSYLGHASLLGLQRPEDRAPLLLSSCSSPITQDIHELRGEDTFLCMLFASARKSASCKKWYILVCSDGFP